MEGFIGRRGGGARGQKSSSVEGEWGSVRQVTWLGLAGWSQSTGKGPVPEPG